MKNVRNFFCVVVFTSERIFHSSHTIFQLRPEWEIINWKIKSFPSASTTVKDETMCKSSTMEQNLNWKNGTEREKKKFPPPIFLCDFHPHHGTHKLKLLIIIQRYERRMSHYELYHLLQDPKVAMGAKSSYENLSESSCLRRRLISIKTCRNKRWWIKISATLLASLRRQ